MNVRSSVDMPNVTDLSSIAAENHPHDTAFADADRRVTWSEFEAESLRAATAFREVMTQGDRVAFICESSVDHITAMNGVIKAGGIPTNLHVRAAPETFRYCLDTVRPSVIVLDEQNSEFFEDRVRDELETEAPTVITLGDARAEYERSYETFVEGQPETEPDVRVRAEDVAAIWWTSGTTGRPKGWCQTHRGILLKALKTSTATDRNSRSLMVLSPAFAAWWGSTMSTMLAGGTMVYRQEWSPEDVVRLVESESLTNVGLVTTMWREILRLDTLDDYDLSSLERILSTGEKLDRTTIRDLSRNVCDTIANGYSSTEVLGTSITNVEMEGDRVESVGKPVLGQRVRIVEEGGTPEDTLPPGEIGEILIKGADAPVWVWGDTATTESEFDDGWWRSGDLGYKDDDGYLFLEGRSDFMITSKGMKVFPSPIEERLDAHEGVEESVVVGVDDEEYGERVTAIVSRSDPEVSAEDLDSWCLSSDALARFERPRKYHFIDDPVPRTASGKLDRHGAIDLVGE